jgi:hypothetical protein
MFRVGNALIGVRIHSFIHSVMEISPHFNYEIVYNSTYANRHVDHQLRPTVLDLTFVMLNLLYSISLRPPAFNPIPNHHCSGLADAAPVFLYISFSGSAADTFWFSSGLN